MSIKASSQNHNFYGPTSLETFPAIQEEATNIVAEAIRTARTSGEGLLGLFTHSMDLLSSARMRAANSSGTENSHLFGRDRKNSSCGVNYTMLCEGCYEDHNKEIIRKIQSVLKNKIPVVGAITEKLFAETSNYNGRNTKFEVELYTGEDIIRLQWNQPYHKDFEKVVQKLDTELEIDRLDAIDFPASDADIELSNSFHGCLKAIKKEFPAHHTHSKMQFALEGLSTTFPSPRKIFAPDGKFSHLEGNSKFLKSIYVIGRVRCEINRGMYCLSQYLTWTYQDYITDPVERMSDLPIMILHQDLYLMEDTLSDIDTIFQRAVTWDKQTQDINELINDVGSIRYLLAHSMPYIRGSAAIAEWLEESIYKSHDLNMQRVPGKSSDLEAFASPTLDTFMNEKYTSTIELSPIVCSSLDSVHQP